jgi:N-acetylneuraminic acid mutarotase
MIVWGGYDGSSVNTGGQYDPVTDSWTATTTAGAPTGRTDHTTVWTGTKMIVCGGFNGSPYTNAGGQYSILSLYVKN